MQKTTISIDEIANNPNLDLTARINHFSQDKRWDSNDLEELAMASIKQDYEFWANKRENVSSRTDELLEEILNGHILSKSEMFEMICSEPETVQMHAKYDTLREKVSGNNGITIDDFYELCNIIGFDSKTTELLEFGFKSKGLIIDSYNDEKIHHR